MKIKEKVLRIFPTMMCNYKCEYCTAYTQFNTPIRYREFTQMPAQDWLSALNNPEIYKHFNQDFQIVISGGEPTLYRELKELCDNLINRNIVIYSNISDKAFKILMSFEKSVKLYPSFNYQIEHKLKGKNALKIWYDYLLQLKEKGHKIYTPHCPNDGTEGIEDLPSFVLKTKIEGIWNNEFYSPYVNQCRVQAKLEDLQSVECCTSHFCVASDGNIYNCQAGLWSKRETNIIGHISKVDWTNFPRLFDCAECGTCHICSQQKAIIQNDKYVENEYQYKPLLLEIARRKQNGNYNFARSG